MELLTKELVEQLGYDYTIQVPIISPAAVSFEFGFIGFTNKLKAFT